MVSQDGALFASKSQTDLIYFLSQFNWIILTRQLRVMRATFFVTIFIQFFAPSRAKNFQPSATEED
jgi:hypothetical protein